MIEYVGAAQTVFATSLRKACSIVISYILFPKPLIPQHVIGAGLVCIALYWNSKVNTVGLVWCALIDMIQTASMIGLL